MSNYVRWGLIVSIFIVLIIGFGIWLFLFLKVKKIRKIQSDNNFEKLKKDKGAKAALERKFIGEPVYALKNQFKKTMDDLDIDFLISTTIRNEFKNVFIEGNTNGYEIITLALRTKATIIVEEERIIDLNLFKKLLVEFKIPKQKIKIIKAKNIKHKFDLIFITDEVDSLTKTFKTIWMHLNSKGILITNNFKENKKAQKELMKYLKLIGARWEFNKNSNGFIVVAK